MQDVLAHENRPPTIRDVARHAGFWMRDDGEVGWATGYGVMNLVSISCGGLADWGFGAMRDRDRY